MAHEPLNLPTLWAGGKAVVPGLLPRLLKPCQARDPENREQRWCTEGEERGWRATQETFVSLSGHCNAHEVVHWLQLIEKVVAHITPNLGLVLIFMGTICVCGIA